MASSIHINHGYPHYSWVEYAENAVGVMVILQTTTGPTAGNEQQYWWNTYRTA